MEHGTELAFTRRLLERFHISSLIVENPENGLPATIDRQLRESLYGVERYDSLLFHAMPEAEDNTIYRFYDEYLCRYLFWRLPGDEIDQYLFIGPYLTEPVSRERIRQLAARLCLPDSAHRFLTLYYEDLPVLENENWLFTIARTLGESLWGGPDSFRMEYIDYMIPDRGRPISITASADQLLESARALETLEENYRHENQLMEAVSKGKIHLVSAAASAVYTMGTEPRIPDSLRNRKNYLIILNTLLRKAAENGGVHPLHIDKMSSEFARRIEQVPSLRQSLTLQEKMIRDYCMLVKNYSLSQYSYHVGRAITLIHYDITADLRLKRVAEYLNVNPSYFSTMFRKECGCTLTEYVNRQRIDRALVLLKNTEKSVQDIASECGFSDPNYFIRLFRRQTGTTPGRYREQERR